MLKYKVSELIAQAKSKADLQNSDFITHSDDIHIINDIWLDLYQKAINAGEKFFLETLPVTNGMELPADFYQLYALKAEHGIQIPRRTANEVQQGLRSYEIKNNRLYLYNVFDSVTMEYFPEPKTLTYPFSPKRYMLDEHYIFGRGNKLYNNTSVFNLETNETIVFNSKHTQAELFQVYEDYIILVEYATEARSILAANYYFYDIQSLELVQTSRTLGRVPVQDMGGQSYLISWSSGKVFTIYENEIDTVITEGQPSKNMVLLDDNRIAQLEGMSSYWDESGNLIFTDDRNIINIFYPEENTYEPADYNQRGVLLCDDPITGNGIWFGNTLYSASKDILLNYPNNLFFSVISYRLAVDYKIKQNEDATQLSARAEEAMYSYFDTITQDDNEPVRIRNVY